MKKIRTTMYLPENLHKQIKSKCEEEGTNMSFVTRFLLEKYIDGKINIAKPKLKGETALKNETESNFKTYREDGSFYSGSWLDNLGR